MDGMLTKDTGLLTSLLAKQLTLLLPAAKAPIPVIMLHGKYDSRRQEHAMLTGREAEEVGSTKDQQQNTAAEQLRYC